MRASRRAALPEWCAGGSTRQYVRVSSEWLCVCVCVCVCVRYVYGIMHIHGFTGIDHRITVSVSCAVVGICLTKYD